jgi:hypothetical protein
MAKGKESLPQSSRRKSAKIAKENFPQVLLYVLPCVLCEIFALFAVKIFSHSGPPRDAAYNHGRP